MDMVETERISVSLDYGWELKVRPVLAFCCDRRKLQKTKG